jgi:peptidoglycan DL-endopeptidase CwlO
MRATRSLIGGAATIAVVGLGLSVLVGTPATAADKAPTWADVQAAKSSQAATQAQVDALTTDLTTLQDQATKTAVASQRAGQAYSLAASKQQQAQQSVDDLDAQAKRAKAKAKDSAAQVAALTVQLSRTGGGDITASMITNAKDASDLLYRVGTMAHLSERSSTILAAAQADQRQVDSLEDQAKTATKALADATDKTKSTYATANDAAAAASTKLTDEQNQEQTLFSQLAYLKNTTATQEAAYFQDQQAKAAQAAIAKAAASKSSGSGTTTTTGGSSGGTAAGGSGSGTTASGSGSSGGTTTTPTTGGTTTTPTTGGGTTTTPTTGGSSSGGGTTTTPTAPTGGGSSTSQAAGAIAYARSKIGDKYVFDAAGPNQFDCSGLVMAAYASVGVATGGHNVVWQYDYFKSLGRLVPLADARPGDILFYSSNGSISGEYHDSIYTGPGTMIEAPNPSATVREVAIWWPWELMPYVARPTGSV